MGIIVWADGRDSAGIDGGRYFGAVE